MPGSRARAPQRIGPARRCSPASTILWDRGLAHSLSHSPMRTRTVIAGVDLNRRWPTAGGSVNRAWGLGRGSLSKTLTCRGDDTPFCLPMQVVVLLTLGPSRRSQLGAQHTPITNLRFMRAGLLRRVELHDLLRSFRLLLLLLDHDLLQYA